MQNRTDASGLICDNRRYRGASACRVDTMLLTIAVLVAISSALIIHKVRVDGRVNNGNLGWMSAQWLAEYRASHLS